MGENVPNYHKLCQMSIKYNKRPQNGRSVRKVYQHLQLQDPPKFTQIWIFGLKTNHLATLVLNQPFSIIYFYDSITYITRRFKRHVSLPWRVEGRIVLQQWSSKKIFGQVFYLEIVFEILVRKK
jgi:hypothetical protein